MATSFGALATDFYINAKLGVKLDLPQSRETVMDFFQRLRQLQPALCRVRRYPNELALETRDDDSLWVALRRTSLRAGAVNPDALADAYTLHREVLAAAPFYLSISPLDVDLLEVVFGFDFEASGNHNQLVWDALLAHSPLARLAGEDACHIIDAQPVVGVALDDDCRAQAFFEVKTRTSSQDIRQRRSPDQPLSVYVTLRQVGPVESVKELPSRFDALARMGEELVEQRAIPHLIAPLRDA
ncbi:MAG: hypothetical protein D6824_06820, partial [Planctomycetota bacterium]